MKLMIGIPLLFDIITYCVLIPMLSYSTNKVYIRPELPTPKLLFYVRAPLEYFPDSNAFYDRYYPGQAVRWNRLHEKMHMIGIRTNLQKLHLITLLNFYTYLLHHFIHILIEHYPPVLCGKHQMIDKHRNVIALMNIFAHLHILRRKRRGIQPAGIESLF